MALLTIEGFEVPVLPGTELRDEPWGDYARAYSGRMRSDRRASHRRVRVVASLFDTADDAVALRTILNTPGPVLCGGTMIGDDAYFHVRDIQFAPQTVDRLSFSFELHETDDSPSPLLFSFDGDAPGVYTFTRSGNVGPFTNADGLLRGAAPNVLRREYLWLDGTYTVATRPDTAAYLLEDARTNLVSSDNFDAGWTSVLTPVITSNISDPAGGTGAYRIADDNGSGQEAKQHAVTFTGGTGLTRVAVFVVREATPAAHCYLMLDTTTGGAGYLTLDITAWTLGVPTVSAVSGSLLGKRPVGNGYWAIYGRSAATINSAASNIAIIYPAGALDAAQGSVDVYRVNVYDDDISSWSILNAGETRNADTLYAPYTHVPQAMSVYVKFIECGSVGESGATLLTVGNTSSTPRAYIQSSGTYYRGIHDPGTATASTLSTAPAWGDTVELLLTISADGTPIISQSINGGAVTQGTGQTAQALGREWYGEVVFLGSLGAFGQNVIAPLLSAKIARGVQTMAYMRDVAKGRLHPRTDVDWAFRARYTLSASVAGTSTATATESP